MRHTLIGLAVLMGLAGLAGPAPAQVSLSIGLPNVRIGINLPLFPQLVRVPGYPVYYAPDVQSNYFFYDGLYWVYEDDNWYSSDWYNGPWGFVDPGRVPLFVLRVPVRYYRSPPSYFRGWTASAPPRWGDHWGNNWQQSHRGWDRWNRASVPAPAPLPVYQRRFPESRYPQVEQQRDLRSQNYRHESRDPVLRQPPVALPDRPRRPEQAPQPPRDRQPQAQPPAPHQEQAPPQRPARQAPPERETPRAPPQSQPREQARDQPRAQPRDQPRDQAPGRGPEPGKGRDKDQERGDNNDDRKKPSGRN